MRSAEVLSILIASPSDVSEERNVVEKVILDWNASHFESTGVMLRPVRWESHAYPASGDRPQALINKQIVESGDILIGIFGYKLGTPTGAAQSGTIEEIEEFRKAGKYVALYFSTANVPRNADRSQLEALEAYKKEREEDTLYFVFDDPAELRGHLTRQLPKIVREARGKLAEVGSLPLGSMRASPKEAHGQPGPSAQNSLLLADLISELDDNFDCASRPRTGDTYRRPSNKKWLESRNKIKFPQDLYLELKTTYNRISSWLDVVLSGLNPNLGSMEFNILVTDLRSSLPSLIERLRKLRDASVSDEPLDQDERDPVPPPVSVPRRRRSLDFLAGLNPKEMEILVLTSQETSGQLFRVHSAGKERISVGSNVLFNSNNARLRAEWIGALENLLALDLVRVAGPKSEFYRLTELGYSAARELSDFAHWPTNQAVIEARYLRPPNQSMTIECTAVVQMPATYYEYRVRADAEAMRSEREPRSLIIEGADLAALNQISWQPTDVSFVVTTTGESKGFIVERADDRKLAKFYIKGGPLSQNVVA